MMASVTVLRHGQSAEGLQPLRNAKLCGGAGVPNPSLVAHRLAAESMLPMALERVRPT